MKATPLVRAHPPAEAPPERSRPRTLLLGLAGPAIIVGAVLFVLHDVAFRGTVSNQHPDLLAFWLPNHCFLGTSLASGRIPAWNPYTLGGTPFAADPQSGWLYLPATALYTVLPCHVAVRWFVLAQPILGGLGTFWFLRSEQLSRPAAAVGGVALSLAVAGSLLALYLPFAGALAWTALLLAAASRFLRAPGLPGRLGWTIAVAVAWGQLVSAHPTNGLALGTGALAAYAAARLTGDVRRGHRTTRSALALGGLLLVAMLAVNLAVLLPRLAYVPRTTMGLGFGRLEALAASASGGPVPAPKVGPGAPPLWPLQLSLWPGLYAGAATLSLAFAGWWNRRHRSLMVAFSAFAAVTYLLSLDAVARAMAPAVRSIPLGGFYLHSPWRFRLGLLVALPVLAAVGAEAWGERRPGRSRLAMLAPGVALWGILPLFVVGPGPMALAAVGDVGTAAALWAAVRTAWGRAALPAVLAVELVAGALLAQGQAREAGRAEFAPTGTSTRPFTNLLEPDIEAAAYVRPGPVVRAVHRAGTSRFASVEPSLTGKPRGLLLHQDPEDWGLTANGRSMLFGLEDAQGYNPVQLLRYWTLVRAANPSPVDYNAAVFVELTPAVRGLLDIDAAVAPADRPPATAARMLASEGTWAAYALPASTPRVSVVQSWTVAPDASGAVRAVLDPAFDSTGTVILEAGPAGAPPPLPEPAPDGPATARYRALGPQSARIDVATEEAGLLVVRNVFDPGWRATVDGRPVQVLVADALLQAVPVPAGRHTVLLSYDDPMVGYGLAGSALAVLALIAAAAAARTRRGARPGAGHSRSPGGPARDPAASSRPPGPGRLPEEPGDA